MRNNRKFLKIIVIAIQILMIFSYNMVCASDLTNKININRGQGNQFIEPGNAVIKVLQTVGVISSIIALMMLGIKYMAGSVEEKADYKKSFPLYLVGIILVFGVSVFAQAIDRIISSI